MGLDAANEGYPLCTYLRVGEGCMAACVDYMGRGLIRVDKN